MKRLILLLLAAAALALVLTPGVAFANFAIHGGYTADTDACAGCHRAHTSVSSITWSDGTNDHSALLVSNATQIYEFCYACHDNAAQGADTNVEGGVYKGSVYGSHDATLNGGFFGYTSAGGAARTSDHIISGGWGAYGGGAYGDPVAANATGDIIGQQVGAGATITMTCASCHDPHGSSNYRLLNDAVNGITVGGYTADETPTPYVVSNEQGYPNGTNGTRVGWLKHEAGHEQIVAYTPNFTEPNYAKAPVDGGGTPDTAKGMSGWCAGCHVVYMRPGRPHDGTQTADASWYNAGDGWGYAERHRHPMNVEVTNTNLTVHTDATKVNLPLAHTPQASANNANAGTDWIDCMTCHVAHGSSAVMTGYANVADATNIQPNSGKGGVAPTGDSALLRMNNRGVCEACHNK